MPDEFPTRWSPLTVDEVEAVFAAAPFFWCLAGGRSLQRLVGQEYRTHEDIDIVVLRTEQVAVQEWLADWTLALADPPGSLRSWPLGERIPWRAHDIWGHRPLASAWELQLMIQEVDGDRWYYRRDDRVNGDLAALARDIDGVPCLRPDLQLLFKAKSTRSKDDEDFAMVLPRLTAAEKTTLSRWLALTSPDGHPWIAMLSNADHRK